LKSVVKFEGLGAKHFTTLNREQEMRITRTILTTLAVAAGPLYGDVTEQPPPTPAQEHPEVLTHGPVSEAFAEPVNLQVHADLAVPNQPPAKIKVKG
jgi:hypothetical protein